MERNEVEIRPMMESKKLDDKHVISSKKYVFIGCAIVYGIICFGIGFGLKSIIGVKARNDVNNVDCDTQEILLTRNNIDFEYVIPTWFDGERGVGIRQNVSALDDGFGMVYRATNRVPLPISSVWGVFDNYLEFQSNEYFEYYGFHDSVSVHVTGPINDTGEIISYQYNGETIYEELNVRNDSSYVLDIRMPLYDGTYSNSIYNRYGYVIRLYEDDYFDYNGCLIVIDIEWEFKTSITTDMRQEIMDLNRIKALNMLKLIYDIAFDNDGLHTPVNITVPVNREWMWNFISYWPNLKWVMLAKQDSLNLTQDDIRIFESLQGTFINERVSVSDSINYIFEYQILNGEYGMPLRDTVQLIKLDDEITLASGKISIFPQPQQDPAALAPLYAFVVNEAATLWPSVLGGFYQNDTANV